MRQLTRELIEQRQRNVRTALILASIACAFFLGFVAKMGWLVG